jgi:cytochrome c oxidase subunit 1
MPRRVYTYADGQGWDLWNLIETAGAFMIAVGALIFVINIINSLRGKPTASGDPWDGQTLEWATSSPPPVYNFATMLPVNSPRPFWDAKYGPHSEFADNPKNIDLSGGGTANIHLPNPSFWPIVLAFGLTVALVGVLFGPETGWLIIPVGLVILSAGFIGWLAQPAS